MHRGYDDDSLRELVRRLAFNVLVGNSDAHAKNFSLLYADPRRPVLSPAYDVVSVAPYDGYGGDIALSIAGKRRADQVRWADLGRLGGRLGVDDAALAEVAEGTTRGAVAAWPRVAEVHLAGHPRVRRAMSEVIRARALSLRS